MLPNPTPSLIILTNDQYEKMRADVDARAPEEACGLLSGQIDGERVVTLEVFPLENALHSEVRYRIDPMQHYQTLLKIENDGLEMIGIYHSHPNGSPKPSQTDIEESYYPEAVYLIWSQMDDRWDCQGFSIQANLSLPVSIIIEPME